MSRGEPKAHVPTPGRQMCCAELIEVSRLCRPPAKEDMQRELVERDTSILYRLQHLEGSSVLRAMRARSLQVSDSRRRPAHKAGIQALSDARSNTPQPAFPPQLPDVACCALSKPARHTRDTTVRENRPAGRVTAMMLGAV